MRPVHRLFRAQGSPPSARVLLGVSPPHLGALLSRGIVPSSPARRCEVAGMQVMLKGRRARRHVGTTPCRSGRTDGSPKELPSPSALPLALGRLLLRSRRTDSSFSVLTRAHHGGDDVGELCAITRNTLTALPSELYVAASVAVSAVGSSPHLSASEWIDLLLPEGAGSREPDSLLLCLLRRLRPCSGHTLPSAPHCPGLGRTRPGHRVPGEHARLPPSPGLLHVHHLSSWPW